MITHLIAAMVGATFGVLVLAFLIGADDDR